jgi:CRISPR-associated protein Cmr4
LYESSLVLYVRALTPVHVGVGRGEAAQVDLPIQRDEYGFPVIWASSLKGAIKANLSDNVRKYLGSEPREETLPSHISLLDARLVLMPVRTLRGVWTYGTTPHLLGYLARYLEIHADVSKAGADVYKEVRQLTNLVPPGATKAISTLVEEKDSLVIVNETELEVEKKKEPLDVLPRVLPSEIAELVKKQGLIIIPDRDGQGLEILSRSLMIQYRVRLSRDTKTVDAGPWSEEYVPMETVFVSVALCRSFKQGDRKIEARDLCEEFRKAINGKTIYVGGKETIGRGLVRLLTYQLGV